MSSSPPTAPTSAPPADRSDPGGTSLTPTPVGRGAIGFSHRTRNLFAYGLLAGLCYLPMLLTKPGVVSDDTKTYLYLDPGRWVRAAPSMWDPSVVLGTVTHQNIGYLLPMGPFYWSLSVLHVPIWVSQRLWLGSILFAAAAGVLYLSHVVNLRGSGRIVAAIAYAFTPYVMQYAGRISVILLPFAGLPWMLAFMIQAVRARGWRYPAAFALVVALVSGINASSIAYVGVAPLLWLVCSVLVTHEATGRQAWGVFWRTGLLTALASLWWLAALSVEGLFGIDILKYTETVQAASSASSASEVVRGLGYWYFYGGDRIGLWTTASVDFTDRLALLAVSYVVPAGAIWAAAFTRWRYRIFFVLLVAVGLMLSVGPHPFGAPTPFGALDKAFMTKTTFGLALRSTDRATPLVVLGLAMLLGAGLSALVQRIGRPGLAVAGVVGLLALGANAPLLAGKSVISQFSQPAVMPSYVQTAAAHLNAVHPGTRVYAIPGDNFAAYRFGDTVDPIWPALLHRPFVVHEQFIQGSLPTANLLYALDNPLQQGTMNWNALAPVARLMSVGDVLVEYDQQYERYDVPRPQLLQAYLAHAPAGLTRPIAFGRPTPNVSSLAMYDETYFGLVPLETPPYPIVSYTVANPRPIARAEPLSHALVVDGDAVGVINAATLGLLAHDPTIIYAGTLPGHPELAGMVLRPSAQLVVTDTNRKQAFEWNSLSENTGYTATAAERPTAFVANDPGFDLFPGTPTTSRTTTVLTGISSVTASAYGTAFTLRSEYRPANAIDGNLGTAWQTEGTAEAPAVGQWWQVTLKHPTSADAVTLTQPQFARDAAWLTNQWLTKVTLSFDGGRPLTVPLDAASRGPRGESVVFRRRTFQTLRIRIDATNFSTGGPPPVGSSLVGLAEVGINDIRTTQIVQVPSDLLRRVGPASIANRLTYLFTRDRVAPVPPRHDPEATLIRQFALPTTRAFALVGTARLSPTAPDGVIDRLVSRFRPGSVVAAATSSSRMPGDLSGTASSTLDGNPATVWSPGLGAGAQIGSWLDYRFRHPLTASRLGLQISSDVHHSVPTAVTVSTERGSRTVELPPIPVTRAAGSVTSVPVSFPPLSGSQLRITFTRVKLRSALSYQTSLETALPIGIAEVGIPGVHAAALPAAVPAHCRSDLLRLDGRPVPVAVTGPASGALAGQGLQVSLCGPGAERAGLRLGSGTHLLQAANGAVTGLNLDQIALDSAPGGAAMPEPGGGMLTAQPPAPSARPTVSLTGRSATTVHLHVTGARAPFLLVFGESVNKGWQASVSGVGNIGGSTLVDGFANGWVINARTIAAASRQGSFDVTLKFAPQRTVDLAILVSALTILACLLIVAFSLLRSRRRRTRVTGNGRPPAAPTAAAGPPSEASEQAADAAGAPDLVAEMPVLSSPVRVGSASGRPALIAVGVIVAALAAWFAGGVIAAVLCAVGVLCAMTLARGRAVLLLGSVVMMSAAVAEVVRHQAVNRYRPGAGWPAHFDLASSMVWAAVLLLSADSVLEIVRGLRARRARRVAA